MIARTSEERAGAARATGRVERLLERLQEDVAIRKTPRGEVFPAARTALVLVVGLGIAHQVGARSAGNAWSAPVPEADQVAILTSQLDRKQGEIDIQSARIERLERAYETSARFGIGADLAILIEDVALAEGIDPEIAYNLVRIESDFEPRAVSGVGALGLTQLMPETAAKLRPGVTRAEIFDPETNLRLGFRFFGYLLAYYEGDVELALHAYNRGPVTVDRLIAEGFDPGNEYASAVLAGIRSTD